MGTTHWSTKPDDMGLDWGTSRGREPHEVMIPPGKCVYYWLGCTGKRFRRNRCIPHYREELAWGEYGPPPPIPQPICPRCRQRQKGARSDLCKICRDADRTKEYYAKNADKVKTKQQQWREAHVEEERKRKAIWRMNNNEHINAYNKAWNAKKSAERKAANAST